MNNSFFLKFISIFEFLLSISAIIGGYSLITKNGMGMPISLLKNSPFSSYFWPGIILIFIIGGTCLAAAIMTWREAQGATKALAISGFGLLIWVFSELYMLQNPHWLQILYFGFGICILITTLYLVKSRTLL